MKKISLIVFILAAIVGCSSLDKRVLGKWVGTGSVGFLTPHVLTFYDDGTYSVYYPPYSGYNAINDKGTYTTKEMPNPKKWKNGGCIIVLDSDYGNDYEIDFIAYETGDSCFLDFYKIETDRNGNVSVSNNVCAQGLYCKRKK